MKSNLKITNVIEGNMLKYFDLVKPPVITEKVYRTEIHSNYKMSREDLMKEAEHDCYYLKSVRLSWEKN
jgi:hypothetical protein